MRGTERPSLGEPRSPRLLHRHGANPAFAALRRAPHDISADACRGFASELCSRENHLACDSLFHPFLGDEGARLVGVDAAGHGLATDKHAAPLSGGRPGGLHGNKTYPLQGDHGQIIDAHSISAGLDYPGIEPEHAWLHDVGRALARVGEIAREVGKGAWS